MIKNVKQKKSYRGIRREMRRAEEEGQGQDAMPGWSSLSLWLKDVGMSYELPGFLSSV